MAKDEEITIGMRAEHGKLRGDLQKGSKAVSSFKSKTLEAFKTLGPAIAGAFAIKSIMSFVKTGILEFAKFENSMDLLIRKVEGVGQGFDGAREQLDGYIRSTESATRFTKFELAASLDTIMLKTRDYNTALALNEKAMDLAVAGNMDLRTAADTLALAYEGNTTGLGQIARVLGLTSEQAKDTELVFRRLDETTKDVARTEEGLAVKIANLNNSMNDAAEIVGGRLGPMLLNIGIKSLNAFTAATERAFKVIDTLGIVVGSMAVKVMNAFQFVKDSASALATFLVDVWKNPTGAFDTMTESLTSSWQTFGRSQEEIAEITGQEIEAIWLKSAAIKNGIDAKALRENLKIKKAEVKGTTDAEKKKLAAKKKAAADRKAFEKADMAERKAALDLEEAEDAERRQRMLDFAGSVASAMAGQMIMMAEAGKGTIREMLNTIIDALKSAAVNQIMISAQIWGMSMAAKASNWKTAIAKYVAAIAFGGVAAAGVTVLANSAKSGIAAAQEGGIVLTPTLLLAGEGNQAEAIIPLDRAAEFGLGANGGGDTIITVNQEFNGISPGEINADEIAQTTALALAEQMQQVNNRRGRRT